MALFVATVYDGEPGALYEVPSDNMEDAEALLLKVLAKGNNQQGPVQINGKVLEAVQSDGFWYEGGFGIYIVSSEQYSVENLP